MIGLRKRGKEIDQHLEFGVWVARSFEIGSQNRLSLLLVTVLWPFSGDKQVECGEQRTEK